jgi:hypothetical protein
MSKKNSLGLGNREHFVCRPGTSHTSPARVKLWRRRAQAMEYREQHRTYREIGRLMGCRPSVAHDLVVGGMKDLIPIERRETVRQMELSRLEELMRVHFPKAKTGDIERTNVYLKVAAEYSKLAGLYPESGGNNQQVNINVDNRSEIAEREGIRVLLHPGMKPDDPRRAGDPLLLEHQPQASPSTSVPEQLQPWPPPPGYGAVKPEQRNNVVPIASRALENVPVERENIWKRGDGPQGWMK